MTRTSARAVLLLVIALLGVPRGTWAAPPKPSSPAGKADGPSNAALAEAKKKFEVGLKLHKEGLVKEALAAFTAADKIVARASVQRNIAQCQRDLKDFAAAYETYTALLDRFGTTLKPAESADVKRAVDELALLTGTIEVKSAEPDAKVVLDEKPLGTTPLAKAVRVNIGTHKVSVTKDGFEPFSKQVDCRGNDQIVVDAVLEKEIRTGHLVVTGSGGSTEGVKVIVDGAEVGSLPWEADLEPGTHQVAGKGPKSEAAPVRVEVARRERSEVTLELVDQVGTVYVDPHNADAEISLDGKVVGKGVWEGKVSPERHELAITAPLHRPYRRILMVHVGERIVEETPLILEEGVNLHSFSGLYVGLNVLGRAATMATNEIAQNCPVDPALCQAKNPLGAGALLRIGYSFGWFGTEVVGFTTFDTSSADAEYRTRLNQPGSASPTSSHYGLPRTESYRFNRFGAGGALGVRATSKHSTIRFTFGSAFGLAYRSLAAQVEADFRNLPAGASSATQNWDSTTGKLVPTLLVDTSLLLGSTPGTKFQLGALLAVEFYGDAVVSSAQSPELVGGVPYGRPGLQMAKGAELFIGPVLGLQFGE